KNIEQYRDPDSDAHHAMVDHICQKLQLTTLRYQRLDDLVEAIGLPREKLCTYCWSGEE
ncbi:MAG: amidophosphoribosyltransferase, partial [Lentisphaerae bacterium]|nr:amidophosphoribosyltransferase [Lentisphaerota bacterium]